MRRDSQRINAFSRRRLLEDFGIDETAFEAAGTEAMVYGLGPEQVLKVYADVAEAGNLSTLSEFYAAIDRASVPLELPLIDRVVVHGDLVAVVERRIPGRPMAQLENQDGAELRTRYVEAVRTTSTMRLARPLGRFRLLDPAATWDRFGGDWNRYVTALLVAYLERVAPLLRPRIPDLAQKMDRLIGRFHEPYRGETGVVHGDLFPGNILVDDGGRPTGVIDFGTFTMFGDPLFDLGTACGYFDMYGPERQVARDKLLADMARGLSDEQTSRMHAYLLVAAVVSCDMYLEADRPVEETGHFNWAVEVLTAAYSWAPV